MGFFDLAVEVALRVAFVAVALSRASALGGVALIVVLPCTRLGLYWLALRRWVMPAETMHGPVAVILVLFLSVLSDRVWRSHALTHNLASALTAVEAMGMLLLAFGAGTIASDAHTFLLPLGLLSLLKFATANGVHDVLHASGGSEGAAIVASGPPTNV